MIWKFVDHRLYPRTGSDCGGLFIWDKRSTELVRKLGADSCTVNSVAPHPFLPTVATSGIDTEARIWTADGTLPEVRNQAKEC